MLRFGAISDLHGALPEIGQCNALFVCGDIFPTEIDRDAQKSQKWFLNEFCNWVRTLPCDRVYLLPGNHSFWIEEMGYDNMVRLIDEETNLHGKLIYVEDSLIEIEGGLTLYACPWCTGPKGWAFVDPTGERYEQIADCDILLTHQPPRIEKLGCSYPNTPKEREFGSVKLAEIIKSHDIKYCICGHIHSGTHGGLTISDCNTVFYNVSIMDENYNPTYRPTYIDVPQEMCFKQVGDCVEIIDADTIRLDYSVYENHKQHTKHENRNQPLDRWLYDTYGKKWLILTNATDCPIKNENNEAKLFWSQYFKRYVSSEL